MCLPLPINLSGFFFVHFSHLLMHTDTSAISAMCCRVICTIIYKKPQHKHLTVSIHVNKSSSHPYNHSQIGACSSLYSQTVTNFPLTNLENPETSLISNVQVPFKYPIFHHSFFMTRNLGDSANITCPFIRLKSGSM